MTHLVTFADPNMTIAGQICEASARLHGVGAVWYWRQGGLWQTDFYKQNKALLDQPKGCGYFAWKPYVIYDTIMNRCNDGDILIYSDAGVEFVADIKHVINRMDQDIFLFSNKFQHAHWCKTDTIQEICGHSDWGQFGYQVQASVIMFRVNRDTRWFVKQWLDYSLIPGLIDDTPSKLPNHPEFQEHRWDQAILTTLAYQQGIKFHWWPAMYNAGHFQYEKCGYKDTYPILFHHHRMRNADFTADDDLNKLMQRHFKKYFA